MKPFCECFQTPATRGSSTICFVCSSMEAFRGALNKIGGLYWAKGMKSKPQDKTVRCELCACAHTCCSKTVVEISWNHWVFFELVWVILISKWLVQVQRQESQIEGFKIFFTVTPAMVNLMKCGQLSTRMWRRSRTIWTLNFLQISFLAHVWLFLNWWLVASCISGTFFAVYPGQTATTFSLATTWIEAVEWCQDLWSIYATDPIERFPAMKIRGKQSLETIVLLFSYKAFHLSDGVWDSKMWHEPDL